MAKRGWSWSTGHGAGRSLVGQMNVDERSDCVNLRALLCMFDEVSLAGLVFGVPLEDVKLYIAYGKQIAQAKKCEKIVVLEDCWLGAVGSGLKRYRRTHAEKSVVLHRQSRVGSP